LTVPYHRFRKQLEDGESTCETTVVSFLAQIRAHESLNAFVTVLEDRALEKAREIDRKLAQGGAGSLAGMVVAVKDLFAMKHVRTTCGSRILERYHSPYDSAVVGRLEEEDAIVIGKTNMDEFGMGSSSENSAYGPVLNPRDPGRTPGGSSGGSAAAVAAGLAMTAIGSDTGGSVRQPAALTGVVGLRPTYGRISRYGLIAFASSLDTVGIFSSDVTDCAILLQALAGRDPRDATSSLLPVPDYAEALRSSVRGLTFGLPREYYGEGLSPEVGEAIHAVVSLIRESGGEIREISLPLTDYGIATYYLICTAEASSNLARYDGVKFGLRIDPEGDLRRMIEETRHEGFGSEVKRRIMLGTYVLSAGYYDAYYLKAQRVRTLIRRDFENAFRECDVLIGPTSPTTAFRLGEKSEDPMAMYLSDIYTVTAPLAGLPAISIPAGLDSRGLPIGLQLTGRAFQEENLLRAGYWIEQVRIRQTGCCQPA